MGSIMTNRIDLCSMSASCNFRIALMYFKKFLVPPKLKPWYCCQISFVSFTFWSCHKYICSKQSMDQFCIATMISPGVHSMMPGWPYPLDSNRWCNITCFASPHVLLNLSLMAWSFQNVNGLSNLPGIHESLKSKMIELHGTVTALVETNVNWRNFRG